MLDTGEGVQARASQGADSQTVAAWIDEYNTERRHSTNGMLPPVAYEAAHAADHEHPVGAAGPPGRSAA